MAAGIHNTQTLRRGVLLLGAVLGLSLRAAETQESGALTTALAVRNLTVAEADRQLPVRLTGVVTFFDETLFSRFIQDETAGIYIREWTNMLILEPGQWVEVVGTTSPGEYAPVVQPREVRVLGERPLPTARPATFQELARGQEDSQFVEVRGIVRSVRTSQFPGYHLVEVGTGGGRLAVYVREIPTAVPEDLVDSTVRVRGVCSTIFNRQRQLFNIRLLVPRAEDFVVEVPAPSNPFAMPASPIGSLLQFTPQGTYGRRVKVVGTVVLQQAGTALFIQDESDGLNVRTHQQTPLEVGDVVEVIGFPAQGDYTPILEDAIYRKIGSGPKPKPERITRDEALAGTHDSRLVQVIGRLVDRSQRAGELALLLDDGTSVFQASLERRETGDAFADLQSGSVLAVTGVCLIEPGQWESGEAWRAASYRLRLRSPADVMILKAPPWWTVRRLLWMSGLLALAILAAMTWVLVLRRRVQEQTEIIRQRLLQEEELKERYLDLFENANDMVFTHDLDGRMTSINKAGERLLQRSREQILSHNLLDLVVEEQRPQARKWMQSVVAGADSQAVEWDFLGADGTRLRLEVSSRPVDRAGRVVEVEGIGRDITQRKRLEREILEISSREQRRIGHDLHDGVCQQLAGIALLTNTLADRLEGGETVDPAEAEKLSHLINEANRQTRAVARGLFPVRLEDNGLVSALEELANNFTGLFKIQCVFTCAQPEPVVENGVALHVYYIAQEALLNAAKHGKAARVNLELKPQGERWELCVRDDGKGFSLQQPPAGGMGIRIMNYRARVIGATLDLRSQPGSGTQVSCVFLPTAVDDPRPQHAGKREPA